MNVTVSTHIPVLEQAETTYDVPGVSQGDVFLFFCGGNFDGEFCLNMPGAKTEIPPPQTSTLFFRSVHSVLSMADPYLEQSELVSESLGRCLARIYISLCIYDGIGFLICVACKNVSVCLSVLSVCVFVYMYVRIISERPIVINNKLYLIVQMFDREQSTLLTFQGCSKIYFV